MEFKGGLSGGSIATILALLETVPVKDIVDSYKPFALSPIGARRMSADQGSVLYDERLGGWIGPWLMGDTNVAVVCRTYGLLGGVWGEKFAYKEYFNYGGWFRSHAFRIALRTGAACLTLPPFRWLLKKVAPGAGEGPTEELLKTGSFIMKIVAETDEEEPKTGTITISTKQDVAYLLTGIYISGCTD